MVNETKEIKWKLRACRAQAGFTQRDVAQFLGCAEKSIVDYENGVSSPIIEKGFKLSELYGIPMSMIDFTKEGNKPMSKLERQMLIARMLPDDEVTAIDLTDELQSE